MDLKETLLELLKIRVGEEFQLSTINKLIEQSKHPLFGTTFPVYMIKEDGNVYFRHPEDTKYMPSKITIYEIYRWHDIIHLGVEVKCQ